MCSWLLDQRKSNVARLALLGFLILVLLMLGSLYLPDSIDWRLTYRPAAWALLRGESPFGDTIFYAAPWSLLPLLPFALLPEAVGRAALFLVGLGVYAYVAHRLGAGRLALIAFLLSPPVMHGLLNANIEWLPLLGFVLPPQVGLLFIAIKPQIGLGVGLFWLVQAWRRGHWREVVRVFWPVTLAFLVSFALFGLWPLRFRDTLELTRSYNASLWPSTIPVGLALLAVAFRKQDICYAMPSAPCLSPYVLLHAWVGALAAILPHTTETVVAVIGIWIVVLIQGLTGAG